MSFRNKIQKRFYSGDHKFKLLDQKYLPRWSVLLLDLGMSLKAQVFTYFILVGTPTLVTSALPISLQMIGVLAITLFYFFIFRTYSGIVRHSTFQDIIKLILSLSCSGLTLLAISYVYQWVYGTVLFTEISLFLYTLLTFVLLLFFRIVVKEAYQMLQHSYNRKAQKRLVIIGVDDATISLGKALIKESNLPFKLIGFLTERAATRRYKILGKPVIHINNNFTEIIKKYAIEGVLLMGNTLTGKEKNEIVELCLGEKIEIFNVPSLEVWNTKEDIKKQIKPIDIEDLLEREPIVIETEFIRDDLEGKTILVTGGAGSIGSEIVRQIAVFKPALIVILDQAESALHEFDLYLQGNLPELNYIIELANISNKYRLEMLFSKYSFDLIFHAAAYKHVPLIERNPHEAIYVNVLGTSQLAMLAVQFEVAKFVMVSTDKAVNPTNVMGASKRVAEIYVQALQGEKGVKTKFITTRFGNVLGSNGSVIPHFRKQILQGGPVTVTHKDIIRYFMTIPEACQLVLQAGTMGKGGETYVFDMGEPVKILSLAEKMIRLSGLEPYIDIDIKISGLRPGEKLFEELLNKECTSIKTHHPKIMISKMQEQEFAIIKGKVKKLVKTATRSNDIEVVRLLKELVPEYKSKNSCFECLD